MSNEMTAKQFAKQTAKQTAKQFAKQTAKPCKPVHGLYYLTKMFCEKIRRYHELWEERLEQNLKVRNYVPRSLEESSRNVDVE